MGLVRYAETNYAYCLVDVVVMATATDLTWERRIDAHSKTLMDPNYVLFWDLRDSAHPQV